MIHISFFLEKPINILLIFMDIFFNILHANLFFHIFHEILIICIIQKSRL